MKTERVKKMANWSAAASDSAGRQNAVRTRISVKAQQGKPVTLENKWSLNCGPDVLRLVEK
jgi:hypothetical protein